MVLIVGHKGNMGRRYGACLSWMNRVWRGVDVGDKWPISEPVTSVIIASPTECHYQHAKQAKSMYNCPILIEKPMTLDMDEAKAMRVWKDNVFVVNNWAHIWPEYHLRPGKQKITYNYYNTGPHDTYENCIQLVYLAKKLKVYTDSPVWECIINDFMVTLKDIHESYIFMLHSFLNMDVDRLWTAEDGYKQLKLLRKKYG